MPRPIFDIKEYELRGEEPKAFTREQQLALNKTTSRVHGQIDWTAQLLGFNGPNYWGQANPRQDFSYNWVGLVETMNEKRQMQTGAFGVYNKNKDYDSWPAPFNRSEVRNSADAAFHIEDDGRSTIVKPLGRDLVATYMDDPVLVVGGVYIFDGEVEFFAHSGGDQEEEEPSIHYETLYGENIFTKLSVLRYMVGALEVSLVGSKAAPVPFEVIKWEDISDWKDPKVYKQFLGIWGNKGNNLSFDFAFDALSLHGSDEHNDLFMEPKIHSVSPLDLLNKVGLEPTPWTGHYPEKFKFQVNGCDDLLVAKPTILSSLHNPRLEGIWPPTILPERYEMGSCISDCNSYVKAWQTVADELHDNGEYDSICPPPHINHDNGEDEPANEVCLATPALPELGSGQPGHPGKVELFKECKYTYTIPGLPSHPYDGCGIETPVNTCLPIPALPLLGGRLPGHDGQVQLFKDCKYTLTLPRLPT